MSTGPGTPISSMVGPVHLPHLGGREDRRPVGKGTSAYQALIAASPGRALAQAAADPAPRIISGAERAKDLRTAVHLATSPRTRDDCQTCSGDAIDVR